MKNNDIKLPSNQKFGVVFTVFFILLGSYFLYNDSLYLGIFLTCVSLIFAILTYFFQSFLSPLNFAWFKFGILLGKLVNPIVMGVLFYLLISPVAVISKLFGRDELKIKKTETNTFWINKKIEKDLKSFKNQY